MVHTVPRVVGFPDSGFYMDIEPIFTPLKAFAVRPTGQNGSSMLAPWCRAQQRALGERAQLEKCLIGSVVASRIETPLFGWQSEYDLDQRGCEMTKACAASDGDV